jgi:hypothetical protein
LRGDADEEGHDDAVRDGRDDTLGDTLPLGDFEAAAESEGDRVPTGDLEGDADTDAEGVDEDEREGDGDVVELADSELAGESESSGLFDALALAADVSEGSADGEVDRVGLSDVTAENVFVTETVLVTPVGKVDGDALPVFADDCDDVAVMTLVLLEDGDSVVESVEVFECVLEPVPVEVVRMVVDSLGDDVIVVDTEAVLLDEALPVRVGDDDCERDMRAVSVSLPEL